MKNTAKTSSHTYPCWTSTLMALSRTTTRTRRSLALSTTRDLRALPHQEAQGIWNLLIRQLQDEPFTTTLPPVTTAQECRTNQRMTAVILDNKRATQECRLKPSKNKIKRRNKEIDRVLHLHDRPRHLRIYHVNQ